MNHPPSQSSTGYGRRLRNYFDGDENKYEIWEVKFLASLRLSKLLDVVTRPAGTDGPEENDVDVARNADVFAEIVQCLDDRSLTLVMRDAKDDGRKAIEILREHYVGKGKPRVIALYTELTSLKMSEDCGLTDYVLKAETAATSLKSAGEEISDSLLVAMVLKGLPMQYNTFKTVVTQSERDMSFTEFKVALRSFEETEKCQQPSASDVTDRVMTAQPTLRTRSNRSAGRAAPTNPSDSVITCYACGRI